VSARKRTSKPSQTIDWLVYHLGGARAAMLGHVKAPDQETALARAFEELEIAPADRRRIIVRPIWAWLKNERHPAMGVLQGAHSRMTGLGNTPPRLRGNAQRAGPLLAAVITMHH
jgi:hypothetical protein